MKKLYILLYMMVSVILASIVVADTTNNYWTFDDILEDSGTNTDHFWSSGNDYRAAIISNGIGLSGTDQYVFNDTVSMNGIQTLEFWFYPDAAGDYANLMYAEDDASCDEGNKIIFSLRSGNVYLRLEKYSQSGGWTINTPADSANIGSWHHLLITNNGTKTGVYINGTAVGSADETSLFGTTDFNNLYMGSRCDGSYDLDGAIDNVRFSDESCDATCISDAYNSHAGKDYSVPPPTTYPPIEINMSYPAPTDSGFGMVNLTNANHIIWINYTTNTTNLISCTMNNTDWTNQTCSSTPFDCCFANNTAITGGFYHIRVWANETNTVNGTNSTVFLVDYTKPTITAESIINTNSTIVIANATGDTNTYPGTSNILRTNFSFYDEREIYSINISLTNGNNTQVFYNTNMGETLYKVNLTYGIGDVGTNTIITRVCNSHTAEQIKELDYYFTKNGINYIIGNDFIRIYPKDYLFYNTPKTDKLTDRYTFTFNKLFAVAVTETFIVESNKPIDIARLQKYGGHLVIPELGDNGYWIDFDNTEATKYNMNKIDDYKIEIIVYNLKSNNILFNSIGELNCESQHFLATNFAAIEGYTSSTTVSSTNAFNLSYHYNPNSMTNVNATLFYNNTPHYGGVVNDGSNFSLSVTSPEIVPGNETNITFNWVVDIDGTSYNLSSKNQSVNDFFLDNCTTYNIRAINFTLRQIENNTKIEGTMEYFFNYSYNNIYKSYSMQITDYNQSFCIFPNTAIITADIQVDYTTPHTATFTGVFNDTILTNVTQTKDLYVSTGTSTVTFTVFDENDKEVEGVFIKIYRWDTGSGEYFLQETLKTNEDGDDLGQIVLNTVWYKFELYYLGELVKEISKKKITSTEEDFHITIGTIPGVIILELMDLDIELAADRTKKNFTLTWVSISYASNDIKLEIIRGNTTDGSSMVSSQTSTNNTDFLFYNITEEITNNISVIYQANVYINSSSDDTYYFITSRTLDFKKEWEILGLFDSVLMSFLLVGTIIAIGLAISAETAIILGIIGLGISFAMGLIMIPLGFLVGMIIVFVILLVRISGGRR